MRRLYTYLQEGEGLRVAVCDDSVLHASRATDSLPDGKPNYTSGL